MTLPYGATVLEHFRRPRNQRTLERPTVARDGYNPLCGDRVRMELQVSGGIIEAATFSANACAICTAAASLLTERLQGSTVRDASAIDDDVMLESLGAHIPAARRNCATLPLRTLQAALSDLTARA